MVKTEDYETDNVAKILKIMCVDAPVIRCAVVAYEWLKLCKKNDFPDCTDRITKGVKKHCAENPKSVACEVPFEPQTTPLMSMEISLAVGCAVGAGVMLIVLIGVVFFMQRKYKKMNQAKGATGTGTGTGTTPETMETGATNCAKY